MLSVFVGSSNISEGYVLKSSRVILHPKYSKITRRHDIALVRIHVHDDDVYCISTALLSKYVCNFPLKWSIFINILLFAEKNTIVPAKHVIVQWLGGRRINNLGLA